MAKLSFSQKNGNQQGAADSFLIITGKRMFYGFVFAIVKNQEDAEGYS